MGDQSLGYPIVNSVYYLLNRHGSTSAYSLKRSVSSTDADALHPSKGKTKVTTTYTILSFESPYTERSIDGVNIKISDTRIFVSPVSTTIIPSDTDFISDGTNTWEIVRVKTYKVNVSDVYYELQVRK